jgi:hypothetical protein
MDENQNMAAEEGSSNIFFDDDEGAQMQAGIGAWTGRDGVEGGDGGGTNPPQGGDVVAARTIPALPGFVVSDLVISDVREKNANGALLCIVVGCSKNAQGRSFTPKPADGDMPPPVPPLRGGGGFCRAHHNAYLIQTGQVDSWECACGNRVVSESDRCGVCHRWRGGCKQNKSGTPSSTKKRAKKKASLPPAADGAVHESPELVAERRAAAEAAMGDLRISDVRETNKNGRTICKVVGCEKLDQARNEGFCRRHYKMIAIVDGFSPSHHDVSEQCAIVGAFAVSDGGGSGDGGVTVDLGRWTCPCGQNISIKQKRCGKCNKASSIFVVFFCEYSFVFFS